MLLYSTNRIILDFSNKYMKISIDLYISFIKRFLYLYLKVLVLWNIKKTEGESLYPRKLMHFV